MHHALIVLAGASLVIWLALVLARGGFWRARERLDGGTPDRAVWPAVAAIVPARDEAEVIARTVRSLVTQDYPGALAVVLVDDHSEDGTAAIARGAAEASGRADRLAIVPSGPLPPGWTGKLWALAEGLREARRVTPDAAFIWFTDADIEHDEASLRRLVDKAEREERDLVSLMVLLSCEGFWEKLLIPPFVFFFAMLYPFAWVNDPRRRTAAAAGGCVLLRFEALERAGGLEPIRAEIIDDCALARRIKRQGRDGRSSIWLGLTTRLRSIRPYKGLGGIWSMVARTAYAQLGHSSALLALTLAGMAAVFVAPPLVLLLYPWHGNGIAASLGAAAWLLMSVAIGPTLRLYRQSLLLAPLLPVAALVYCAMTVDSALSYRRGRGGAWKGRVQGRAGSSALR